MSYYNYRETDYKILFRGRYFDVSCLINLLNKLGLGNQTEEKVILLCMDFQFLDMFLSLQSFTTECWVATQKVQALWDAVVFERIHYPNDLKSMLYKLRQQIQEIKLEIKAKYSFPEASPPVSSDVATLEFLNGFIHTVVTNLTAFQHISAEYSQLVVKELKLFARYTQLVVRELKLLRNFVNFILDRCTDSQSQHTFFTHVLILAGHAAIISWLNVPYGWSSAKPKYGYWYPIFAGIQKEILQPCIRKIYIDVLKSIKSGCHPNIQADYRFGFVETLIHHLKVLHTDEQKGAQAFKDRITMLNLLRDHFINLPIEALEDFDTTIINVGLLVYSMDDSVAAVGESNQVTGVDIQITQAQVYSLTRKSFRSNLPKIDGLGSLDIILEHLKELLSRYSKSLSSIMSQLQEIQQRLERFQKQRDGLGSFAMQVIAKAYEVEYMVIGCINKKIPEWCLFSWTPDILEEITVLLTEKGVEIPEKRVPDLVEISEKRVPDLVEIPENRVPDLVEIPEKGVPDLVEIPEKRVPDVASAHTLEMVGFQEVMDTLKRQLIRGSSHLDVISIVGMPGLGKTTLANKLFFDQSVVNHFNVHAQCCVSQVYTRKDLLLTILRGVTKDIVVRDRLPENELADKLQKLLKVNRYLILIDDVWETAAWDDLYPCFYDANNGSKIILTTRLGAVAYHAKVISDPHFLRMFTPEESWMLLKNKVFSTPNGCSPVLEDVGRKIAQKCGGLPLSVVLVAGILKTMKEEKHCWEQVATNLGSHIQAESNDIVNLSYQDLPFHLKPCFLYFGVFLEDEEIQVSKLTWLWTAEGLIKTHEDELSEDYLKELIERNLVMVSKKSSDGKTKSCRIHDLLHDFCKNKAKLENFLQCIKGDNKNMNPSSISYQNHGIPRCLRLYFQGDNLAEWSLVCSNVQSFHLMKGIQIASSSIQHASYTFNNFKFLRVLNLEFTVIDSFPEALTCLRYVAVRIADDSSLTFLGNLRNLETLIVKGLNGRVTLPATLWKMVKLRHLHVYNRIVFNINNAIRKMDGLRTLSSAWFSCVEDTNGVFAKMPNLQKLRCEVMTCDAFFPAFNNLTKLEMLKFSWGRAGAWATELNLPSRLKKLTLSNGRVSNLDQVATLSGLEVLKLLHVSIGSKVWKVTKEQFPQLKFLKLEDPSFSGWNVSDDAFPCLEHLVLRRLRHLQEIPSHFADVLTLKSIEVIACTKSLVQSAEDIRETQVEELQNCGFKLFIQK